MNVKRGKALIDYRRFSERPSLYMRIWYFLFRSSNIESNKLLKLCYLILYRAVSSFNGIEIPYDTKIGDGLYIGHPYNITINGLSVIGKNCNIHKGVVIGQENRGVRKGAPIIGDSVWIGINVAIVGNIRIGDDVLIAPNSFVNCDVPSHSIVFGNPCIIKNHDNATEGYINNLV